MSLFTQTTLHWTLLGLLLVWMIICAILALRPEPKKETPITLDGTSIPSNSFAFAPTYTLVQVNTPQHIPVLLRADTGSHAIPSDVNVLLRADTASHTIPSDVKTISAM